jgi:hypothetical protein
VALALAPAALVLAHLIFFWRAALLRGFLVHGDICLFFEPVKAYLHEALRAGRLALWSPYMFCGYPIAAEGQIATFYPVSLLISWLLPSPGAVNWLIISHLIIAGVSMYALARALGASQFSAWLSGMVFSFSGYLFAHTHHVSLVCAAAWLPLTILFVERAWHKAVLPNAVFGALTWAACALSGHPQTLFHVALVVIFWVSWRLVQAKRATRRWPLGRAGWLLAVVLGLGFGLAAVQLLLTSDLAARSFHGLRKNLAYVTSYSLLTSHLKGLVSPNWQGTPAFDSYQGENFYWEYVLYIGLAPLVLAAIGAATRRGWALAGLAVGALVLALADGNPLYQLLRLLPGFGDFRVPARYILVFTFAAALLCGYGWDTVASLRWLRSRRTVYAVASALVVFVAGDLLRFDRTLGPLASRKVYAEPAAAAALRRDNAWGRVLIQPPEAVDASWLPEGGWYDDPDGWRRARELLSANVPQSYGLRSVAGYAGFTDSHHEQFFRTAFARGLFNRQPGLLALVGVRDYAVGPAMYAPGQFVQSAGPFSLYRYGQAFPRVFAASAAAQCQDFGEALRRTLELAIAGRLGDTAVVQGDLGPSGIHAGPPPMLRVRELRPERIVVDTRSETDRLLVLNERYDPGWRAYCDGRAARLLPADTVLMGTPLPGGEHRIELVYRPTSFLIGRTLSLASLALCVVLLAVGIVRARRTMDTPS